MGRGGIRRRKRRGERRSSRASEARGGEILDDLQDQAAWSSYTQHIPRLGNRFRQRIWQARLGRVLGQPSMWLLGGLAGMIITGIALIAWAIGTLFS